MTVATSMVTLLYHDVTDAGAFDDTGFRGPLADTYKLRTPDFIAHLDAIASRHPDNKPALVTDALPARSSRTPWLLTFDDGGVTALHPTADLLEARGWRGHFFITTGRTGTPGFLDEDGVRELRARGHAIGAHSVTHPARMAELDDASMLREWKDSRASLEAMLNEPVLTGSVPGGLYSDRVTTAAAKAGLRILFNSEPSRKIRTVNDCTVIGRFAFKTHSSPQLVANIAAESPGTMFTQWCSWTAKTAVKKASPGAFRVLRKLITRNT